MDDPLGGIDLEKHGLDRQVLETREQTRLLKEQMRREQRAADEISFREEREQVPTPVPPSRVAPFVAVNVVGNVVAASSRV